MVLRAIVACKERTLKGNHNSKTNSQTLEVQPYQFDNLIKVMVAHIHLVLGHALVGPFIKVDKEGDEEFLPTSHRRYAEAVREKVVHVFDGRVPLVEGPLVVNKCQGTFLIKSQRIIHRLSPYHRLNIQAKHQPIEGVLKHHQP